MPSPVASGSIVTCPGCRAAVRCIGEPERVMHHLTPWRTDCASGGIPRPITSLVDTGRRPVPYVAPDRTVATRDRGATSPPAGDRSTPASHRATAHAAAPVPEGGR